MIQCNYHDGPFAIKEDIWAAHREDRLEPTMDYWEPRGMPDFSYGRWGGGG